MKNVSRDSPWNLILHTLVISAQTGNGILKTAFTGNGNLTLCFTIFYYDQSTQTSCVTLSCDRFAKSIPLVLQDQLVLWSVNFFVA